MSVQYTRGCAVHWGMFSTPRGYHEYSGGYHEYTGGVQYTGGYHDKCGVRSLQIQLNLYGNPTVLNIPWCTHDIPPHSSWYPPVYSWYPPTVLNTPQCSHDIPPVYWTSPVYSIISPWCTQWYPPGVLHTSRCTAQTLCRVDRVQFSFQSPKQCIIQHFKEHKTVLYWVFEDRNDGRPFKLYLPYGSCSVFQFEGLTSFLSSKTP